MRRRVSFLFLLFFPVVGSLAQSRFAYLNSHDIISEMPDYKVAISTLDDMQKKYKDELNRTEEDFNKKFQEYIAQVDSLPRNIAERRQKEIQDMAQRQEQFQQDAYESIQKAREEVLAPILQKVNDAIKAVGEAGGYTFIFDLSKTPIPYVGSESEDITEKIKELIQAR